MTSIKTMGPEQCANALAIARAAKGALGVNLVTLPGETLQAILDRAHAEIKALEAQREAATRPLLEAKREVDSWFAPVRDAYAEIKSTAAAELGRRKAEAQAEHARALRAAASAAAVADHAAASVAIAAVNAAAAVDTSGLTSRWVPRVVDAAAVPREYCCPDVAALTAIGRAYKVDAAPPAIAGVVWERTVTVRAKGKR